MVKPQNPEGLQEGMALPQPWGKELRRVVQDEKGPLEMPRDQDLIHRGAWEEACVAEGISEGVVGLGGIPVLLVGNKATGKPPYYATLF